MAAASSLRAGAGAGAQQLRAGAGAPSRIVVTGDSSDSDGGGGGGPAAPGGERVVPAVYACVLPLVLDPASGELFVLLAASRNTVSWAQGSARVTAFGGRHDASAPGATVEATAAREFLQETCGCVPFHASDVGGGVRRGWSDVARALQSEDYLYRVDWEDEEGGCVAFVRQLPWDATAPARFRHARTLLGALDKAARGHPLREPEARALWPAAAGERHARHTWLRYHPAVRVERWRLAPAEARALQDHWYSHAPWRPPSPLAVTPPWAPATRFAPAAASAAAASAAAASAAAASAAAASAASAAVAPREVRQWRTDGADDERGWVVAGGGSGAAAPLPPPAAVVVGVDGHWLEKVELALWSVAALQHALACGGQLPQLVRDSASDDDHRGMQACAPRLLTLLQIVLRQVARDHPRLATRLL